MDSLINFYLEAFLLASLAVNFGVAEIMYLFGFGGSRLIAPLIGFFVALIVFHISPMTMLWPACIISCIVTAVVSFLFDRTL